MSYSSPTLIKCIREVDGGNARVRSLGDLVYLKTLLQRCKAFLEGVEHPREGKNWILSIAFAYCRQG